MALINFNYYYLIAQQPNIVEGYVWTSQYAYMAGSVTSYSTRKIQVLADNYTSEYIVVVNNPRSWYIDVQNPFIVTFGYGNPELDTAYTDNIKLAKINPLHYRDQQFRLYFFITDNFVTDTDSSNYFLVQDNTLIDYYDSMVNVFYPPAT